MFTTCTYNYQRGMYCTAMASIPTAHLIQGRVLSVAVLVWLGVFLSALALPPSLFLSKPSYTAVQGNLVVPFARSATVQSVRSKAPPKWCLFSIPPPSQDVLSAWPGSEESPRSDLDGALYKF